MSARMQLPPLIPLLEDCWLLASFLVLPHLVLEMQAKFTIKISHLKIFLRQILYDYHISINYFPFSIIYLGLLDRFAFQGIHQHIVLRHFRLEWLFKLTTNQLISLDQYKYLWWKIKIVYSLEISNPSRYRNIRNVSLNFKSCKILFQCTIRTWNKMCEFMAFLSLLI